MQSSLFHSENIGELECSQEHSDVDVYQWKCTKCALVTKFYTFSVKTSKKILFREQNPQGVLKCDWL